MIFLRRKPSIFPLFCWWRCHEVGKRQSDWTNISWVMWQNGLQAQLCIRSWASAGTTRFAFAKKKSRWLLRCQKLRYSAIVVVCELAPSLNIIWWCEAQVDEVENQRAPQKWYMYTHVVLTAIQHVLFMGGPNQGWWKRPTGDWWKQHEKKRNDGAWRAWMTVIHNLRFVIHENSGYGNRYWNNSGWTSRVYIHTSFTILTDAAPQEEKHQKGIVRWPFWPVNSQYLVDSRLSCSSIVTCNQSKNSPA